MRKEVYLERNAEKELLKLSEEVQDEFYGHFKTLGEKGKLGFPEAKKITKHLFEIRVKLKGEYRGLYAYIGKTEIIILHVFQKKSQKTPLRNLKIAKRRLRQYE